MLQCLPRTVAERCAGGRTAVAQRLSEYVGGMGGGSGGLELVMASIARWLPAGWPRWPLTPGVPRSLYPIRVSVAGGEQVPGRGANVPLVEVEPIEACRQAVERGGGD